MPLYRAGLARLTLLALLAPTLAAADGVPELRVREDAVPARIPDLGELRRRTAALTGNTTAAQPLTGVAKELRVQTALRDAAAAMDAGDSGRAIELLEGILASADGRPSVLLALERAYRDEMAARLRVADTAAAKAVGAKLRLIGGSAPTFGKVTHTHTTTAHTTTAEKTTPPRRTFADDAIPVATAKGGRRVVRAKIETDLTAAPVADTAALRRGAEPAAEAAVTDPDVRRADELVRGGDCAAALPIYEKAYAADPARLGSARRRYGYCLLVRGVARFNEQRDADAADVDAAELAALAKDLRFARRLAPSYAAETDAALDAIDQLRRWHDFETNAVAGRPAESATEFVSASIDVAERVRTTPERFRKPDLAEVAEAPVNHRGVDATGWSVTDSGDFTIYHMGNPALAEQVAPLLHRARVRIHKQWFAGEAMDAWTPKCEVFLFPDLNSYRSNTNGGDSPGHAVVDNRGGRIMSRRLFLQAQYPTMKDAVLPHEVAHIVFADRFGGKPLPRWADEGMAVLTEPLDKQRDHLRNLRGMSAQKRLFSCEQMVTMAEYPGARTRDFYAQSVGLCRFLVDLGGEEKFVRFMRQSLSTGFYPLGLREVYGIGTVGELEQRFLGFAAGRTAQVASAR